MANVVGAVSVREQSSGGTHLGGDRKLWWTFPVHIISIHTHIKGWLCLSPGTEALVLDMALSASNNARSHKILLSSYSLAHSRCSGGLWGRRGRREGAEDPL